MGREIKIGDRIGLVKRSDRTIKNRPSLAVGDEGTVVHITNGYDIRTDWIAPKLFGIDWRKPITNGHDCQGHCNAGHGSYVEPDEITVI